MTGDGFQIIALQREFDAARRIVRQAGQQIAPAAVGIVQRDGAPAARALGGGFDVHVTDVAGQAFGGGESVLPHPQPVGHIEGHADRQVAIFRGVEKGVQHRQNAAVRRLIVFDHQFDRVLLQRHFQLGKIKTGAEMAEGQLQLARVQRLRFRQQRRQVGVQRMLRGEQRLRGGVDGEQLLAFDFLRQAGRLSNSPAANSSRRISTRRRPRRR